MKRLASLLCALLCLCGLAKAETFPPSSTPTIRGIDVSAWQQSIDWRSVYESGVRIAMIRASEGDGFVDPYFERNEAEAKAAGVKVGYYHFLTAQNEAQAIAQADFFARVIAGKTPDCRLALDYGGGATLSGAALTANALAFLQRLQTQTGLDVMLYTDAWAAKARFGATLTKYPIWVANYGVAEPEANGKWSSWVGFQYSDRGTVAGIAGRVDLDEFTAQVFQGSTPPVPPTPEATGMLYYLNPETALVSDVAGRLGTTVTSLRSLNEIVNDRVQAGQVLRYPATEKASTLHFASLHVVQRLENLSTLARRYHTTVATLRELNLVQHTFTGQILKIPQVPTRTDVQAPPSHFLESVTEVRQGQTLASIAAAYGVSVDDLRTINGLQGSTVWTGQLLHLQAFGNDEAATFRGGYVVQSGDSLVKIARRFGTTAQRLYQLNNITRRSLIYTGQILQLP